MMPAQQATAGLTLATHPANVPAVSATLAHLARLGTLVGEIGAALALPAARLAEAETLDRLELLARLPVPALSALPRTALERWFAAFGDDLAFDLEVDGQDPDAPAITATLRAGDAPGSALAAFVAAARAVAATQGDDVIVSVRLALGKNRALALAREVAAARGADESALPVPAIPLVDVHAFVFYVTAAWNNLLALEDLTLWERWQVVRTEGRALIIICDAAGYLAGIALEVLGARTPFAPHWLAVTTSATREFARRTAAVRVLRAQESMWASAPRVLTPAHLRLATLEPGLETTVARLALLRAALAAAYLASTVDGAWEVGFTLGFAGARPASCALAPDLAAPLGTPGAASAAHTVAHWAVSEDAGALARLAAWAYAGALPGTLAIARECLARELPAAQPVTLDGLEHAAAAALEGARANFTLFVRSHTEQYFRLRQAAQDAVTAYAASVGRAVTSLMDDMVGNASRMLGLLVGAAVAWVIAPGATFGVLAVAALLTALYVRYGVLQLFLPACYAQYTTQARSLVARLAEMGELVATERERIRAGARPAEELFVRYYVRTRLIYQRVAWFSLALALALAGAAVITHLPLAHPALPAHPIPTVTPSGQ